MYALRIIIKLSSHLWKNSINMNSYTLTEKLRKARRRFRLTATEQALFYELVAVCNEENWSDVFDCSNEELYVPLHIDEKTLNKARQSLISAGLIYYRSGKSKRKASSYSFTVPFEEINTTTGIIPVDTPTNQPTNEGVNVPTNVPDYLKGKTETKLNTPPLPPRGKDEGEISECFPSNPPDDGIRRNYPGLLRELETMKCPPDEKKQIVLLSNFGEIGNQVWGVLAEIRGNSGIRMPGKFILSRLSP